MENNFTVNKTFSLYLEQIGKVADLAKRYSKNGKAAPAARVAIDFLYSQPDEVIAAAFEKYGAEGTEVQA